MAPARNTRSSKNDRTSDPDPVGEEEVSDSDMQDNPIINPTDTLPYDDRPQEEQQGTGAGEELGEEPSGEDQGDQGSKKEDGTEENNKEKPARKPSQPKMNWGLEEEYELMLLMLSGKAIPNRHSGAIAKTFRQNPSGKAVMEAMNKLLKKGLAREREKGMDKEFANNPGRKRKRSSGEGDEADDLLPPAHMPKILKVDRPTPDYPAAPEIGKDRRVFEDYPVTWSQLPEDLRQQVRDACAKLKPDMDRQYKEASYNNRVAAQRRFLAKQKEDEEDEREKREAAETLVSISEQGEKRKQTVLERETREKIDELTGSGGQKGGDDAETMEEDDDDDDDEASAEE